MKVKAIRDIKDIIKNDDGSYTVVTKEYISKAGPRLVTADWREVPHYGKDGNLLDPDVFAKQTISKFGKQYHAQVNECEFLGSASTLISTDALRLMESKDPILLDNIFNGIRVYEKVNANHNYIVSVDPSKDGIDKFAVQVTDITKFPFIQVASAQLDVDYLMMPEHLETLGLYYNTAYIVIENNEGAGQSIADMLYLTYEYPNMYRDRDVNDKKYKKFYGFRTTTKSRPLIINMMKIFIEEGKLVVNDKSTISEFFNFIKSDNNKVKYEAEEGYHDDMVMSLALLFAPFMHVKAFDDLEMFLNVLHIDADDDDSDINTAEYYSLLDFGSFNDSEVDPILSRDEILSKIANSYDPDEQYNAIRQLNR